MFDGLYTIHMANDTEMGQNSISQIPVKSEHGYSPKYAEHIFNVILLSLCRHGLDHKLRKITNCDGRDSWIVAICDCRNYNNMKIRLQVYVFKCYVVSLNVNFKHSLLNVKCRGLTPDNETLTSLLIKAVHKTDFTHAVLKSGCKFVSK